jgi:hypothetical protein
MLPPEAIQEFKTLYQNHFGELLSDEEASQRAEKFLALYRAVYLPSAPADSSSQRDHSGGPLSGTKK